MNYNQSKENNPHWKGGKESFICLRCGKEFERYRCSFFKKGFNPTKRYFCSKKCRNIGDKYCTGGYRYKFTPDHHYATKDGYVLEHRLVMERKLGRILFPEETVHHKNGNTVDNQIENLELFSCGGEHNRFHYKELLIKNGKIVGKSP